MKVVKNADGTYLVIPSIQERKVLDTITSSDVRVLERFLEEWMVKKEMELRRATAHTIMRHFLAASTSTQQAVMDLLLRPST